MSKRIHILFLYLLSVMLFSCSIRPEFERYDGEPLTIAVVGKAPDIYEEQVKFAEISFEHLINDEFDQYDAVFVMEDHLQEASERGYADIYRNATIPFFFISATNHIPFTNEEVKFEKYWEWKPGKSYAVGFLSSSQDESLEAWKYNLYNDEKTNETIKNVYSNIFETIAGLKSN